MRNVHCRAGCHMGHLIWSSKKLKREAIETGSCSTNGSIKGCFVLFLTNTFQIGKLNILAAVQLSLGLLTLPCSLLLPCYQCVVGRSAPRWGRGLSASVDLVTFVMSSRGLAPSSPSSVAANTAFIIQITPLFSYVCDFMAGHLPVLV